MEVMHVYLERVNAFIKTKEANKPTALSNLSNRLKVRETLLAH